MVSAPSLSSGVYFPFHCWVWNTRRTCWVCTTRRTCWVCTTRQGYAGYVPPSRLCWVWYTRVDHAGYGTPVLTMLGMYLPYHPGYVPTLPPWVYLPPTVLPGTLSPLCSVQGEEALGSRGRDSPG